MDERAFALDIISTLRANGFIALMAGGCVRDALLGREPSDYDVATDAPPDRISRLFPRTAEVGACFGVVLVRSQGLTVEVATFRADGRYTDARRPDTVTFSNPADDAARRDYTVNALFWSPDRPTGTAFDHAQSTPAPTGGWIIDFVGGLQDLDHRLIRAVGNPDQRLAEDHLRALRAVRLAAKLAFAIHPDTAAAITRHASDLRGVSRERIGEELRMMLDHPTRAGAVDALASLGLIGSVLGLEGGGSGPALAKISAGAGFAVALGAWLVDLGRVSPADLGVVRKSLMLSNEEREAIAGTLASLAEVTGKWGEWGVARRKREAAKEWFGGVLEILGGVNPGLRERVKSDSDELSKTPSGIQPKPLVTGDTLTRLGLRPGPAFKKVLDAVYDAQLEDRITTEAQGEAEALAAWGRFKGG